MDAFVGGCQVTHMPSGSVLPGASGLMMNNEVSIPIHASPFGVHDTSQTVDPQTK